MIFFSKLLEFVFGVFTNPDIDIFIHTIKCNDNTFNIQTRHLDELYYHSSVIQALQEEDRIFDQLFTRTREILRNHEVNFARQQLTDTVRHLLQYHIIKKRKKGRTMIYSINDSPGAHEGIKFIIAVEQVSSTFDQNDWLIEQYGQSVEQILETRPENMNKLLRDTTTKLVQFATLLLHFNVKLLYFQGESMRLPFLVPELRQQERRARQQYDRVSMIAQRMGHPYLRTFHERLDSVTAKSIIKNWEKFVKDNQFFN